MAELIAGVDLGGTNIKLAIATNNGTIIEDRSAPTCAERGPDDVLQRIAAHLSDMLNRHASSRLLGVGMGVPGLVEVESGLIQFLPNLHTQWRGIPAARYLMQRLKCPVKVLNDVRTATLGELRHGHGRSNPRLTMAFFSIGTGIGGGVVIDGKLRLGPLGAAGELGHQTVIFDGPRCGCGNTGCLETVAGGAALVAEGVRLVRCGMAPELSRLINNDVSNITPKLMAEAAAKDSSVHQVILRAASYLGIAAANVVNILHPDLVVLGGGVSEMETLLLDTVREVVRMRVGMFPTTNIRIEKSMLGQQAGIIGAVALAAEAIESADMDADQTL